MDLSQLVVGVDGGGSKTDVAVVTLDGQLVNRLRGGGSSPHFEGLDKSVQTLDNLVSEATEGGTVVQVGAYMSGLDLEREVEDYRAALATKIWAQQGLTVDNDLFAVLRSGTTNPNAVAVICGTGLNALGVDASGQVVRFLSLGELSGDWGGGLGLGNQALWHAARDVDGRGPETGLTPAIEEYFGLPIPELIEGIHLENIPQSALAGLAPAVFACSGDADPVAEKLVDRQAEEVAAYVRACTRRLDLEGAVDIVLGGSILRTKDPRLMDGIRSAVSHLLPLARLVTPTCDPVVGAVLLAMEGKGATEEAKRRAAEALG